ncbi:MAG: hypothetical protein Q8O98_00630, partial [bacterium]|nr:hypothetical protein [bacterium]
AQVESLRREIAPHLKFLKKQVEKYEKAESMRTDLETLAKQYFKAEEEYLNNGRQRTKNERQAIEAGLAKLAGELAEAKKTLEKVASEKNKGQQVLELESEIARTRAKKSGFERELGRVEGLIDATDRTIKKERELAASEEHKMIRLKDVEELLDEVSSLTLVEKIVERIKEFIKERRSEASSTRIIEAEARIEELSKEKQDAEHALNKLNEEESELRKKYEDLKKEIEQDKDSGRDAEKAVFGIMSEENELRSKLSLVRAEEEKLNLEEAEFRRELEEVGHLVGPEVLKYREASESSNSHASPSLRGLPRDSNVEDSSALQAERREQEERKREIQKLKIRLEDAGLSGADEVLKEHKETSERDEFLARELLDLLKSAESLKELVKDLQERLATEFSSGIEKINKEFGELFQLMFGGGEAELVLVKEVGRSGGIRSELGNLDLGSDLEETEEEIEEGLDIKVNLPRKKIRSLMMLSGGERALTSIALIFALSAVNPPPFIILDETDAALDEANSRKYGDMVERLAKRSQLILITHNRETMSRAGVIYGVTMSSSGASKLLSIAFDDAVQVAK